MKGFEWYGDLAPGLVQFGVRKGGFGGAIHALGPGVQRNPVPRTCRSREGSWMSRWREIVTRQCTSRPQSGVLKGGAPGSYILCRSGWTEPWP